MSIPHAVGLPDPVEKIRVEKTRDNSYHARIMDEIVRGATAMNSWGEDYISDDTLLKELEYITRNLRQIIKGE